MVALNSSVGKEVENLMERSNEEFDKGDYTLSINLLKEAWGKLPEPKGIYDDSFHIILYIAETFLLIDDPENAMDWAKLIFKCDTERIDSGEREFLIGKIAFAQGNMEEAKQYFMIANEKSEGRCFEDEDNQYYEFLK